LQSALVRKSRPWRLRLDTRQSHCRGATSHCRVSTLKHDGKQNKWHLKDTRLCWNGFVLVCWNEERFGYNLKTICMTCKITFSWFSLSIQNRSVFTNSTQCVFFFIFMETFNYSAIITFLLYPNLSAYVNLKIKTVNREIFVFTLVVWLNGDK
jgi:hypothetical protein